MSWLTTGWIIISSSKSEPPPKKDTHLSLHIFIAPPHPHSFLCNLKSLCQDKVNSYLKCTSVQVIFKWLTPRTASTAKTARGSRTVHTPWTMINFDVKEGSEPNICWQPHLIRTSRNVTAFKVRGPTITIASSSRVWSKELWYTRSTVCAWNWNLAGEAAEACDVHVGRRECEVCACVNMHIVCLCLWCFTAQGQLVPAIHTLCYIVSGWFNHISLGWWQRLIGCFTHLLGHICLCSKTWVHTHKVKTQELSWTFYWKLDSPIYSKPHEFLNLPISQEEV